MLPESENSEVIDEGLSALSDSLDDQRSDLSEGAIAAHEADSVATAEAIAPLRDASGASFDASLHVTNADGTPKLTASGKLRKRPGRKSGGASSLGGLKRDGQTTPADLAQSRQAGIELANLMLSLSVQVGGSDFAPEKGEQEHIENTFARYAEIKGFKEFSPGWALAITVAGYYGKRAVMPDTRTRLQRAKVWLAQKLVAIKVKKNGARADIRHDGKRENDTSEKARESFARPPR
jgi:hypothetical protein